MRQYFAQCHVGLRGLRYTPGERLPELTEEEYKSLAKEDAVRIIDEADPPEKTDWPEEPPEAPEDENETESESAPEEPEAAADAPQGEAEEESAPLPMIDATAGIVDDEPKPAAKTRKNAKSKKAGETK